VLSRLALRLPMRAAILRREQRTFAAHGPTVLRVHKIDCMQPRQRPRLLPRPSAEGASRQKAEGSEQKTENRRQKAVRAGLAMRCYLAARCSPSVAHIQLPTAFCLLPSALSEPAGEDAREADEGNEGGHLLPEALPLIVRHEHLIARIE